MVPVVFVIFALLIASFAVFNAVPVDLNLMFWKTTAPLSIVIMISAAAGGVLASLLLLPRHLRGFWQVRELRAKVRRLEGEMRSLKEVDNRTKQEAAASPAATSAPSPSTFCRGNDQKR